jgi:hypothetical protein
MAMKSARMLTRGLPLALLITILLLLASSFLFARPGVAAMLLNGAGYTLDWWTVDGGGTTSGGGGGYTLGSTSGQTDADLLEGGGYTLASGFWAGSAMTYRVYLPLGMRDWRGENWEQEPNGISTQANGPIASNQIYYGTMPLGDTNDYFYFDLPTAGSAELWLTHVPSGCNYDLVLRDAALGVAGYSASLGSADEHIQTGTLAAGRYYVQVYHNSAAGSAQEYHLRVVYP